MFAQPDIAQSFQSPTVRVLLGAIAIALLYVLWKEVRKIPAKLFTLMATAFVDMVGLLMIIPLLAMAGSLARKKVVPMTAGSLATRRRGQRCAPGSGRASTASTATAPASQRSRTFSIVPCDVAPRRSARGRRPRMIRWDR